MRNYCINILVICWFDFGGKKDIFPFQGLLKEVASHFGVGSFIKNCQELLKLIDTSSTLP